MKAKKRVPPVGELRQSQVLTTFGPGAMDRLAARVCDQLGLEEVAFYAPPIDTGELFGPQTGITAFLFPIWFLGQVDETFEADGREYRTRPLVPWKRLVKGGYLTPERKIAPVVPVRCEPSPPSAPRCKPWQTGSSWCGRARKNPGR